MYYLCSINLNFFNYDKKKSLDTGSSVQAILNSSSIGFGHFILLRTNGRWRNRPSSCMGSVSSLCYFSNSYLLICYWSNSLFLHQRRITMKDTFIILASISFCIAGIFEAFMDIIQFKFFQSPFVKLDHRFWNPSVSWQNKWSQGDPKFGPKFFGSTTFLVWTTDGWHLMKWLRNRFVELTILFLLLCFLPLEYSLLITIFTSILSKSLFEIFFNSFS